MKNKKGHVLHHFIDHFIACIVLYYSLKIITTEKCDKNAVTVGCYLFHAKMLVFIIIMIYVSFSYFFFSVIFFQGEILHAVSDRWRWCSEVFSVQLHLDNRYQGNQERDPVAA